MKTELKKKSDIYKVFNEFALKNEIVIFGSTFSAYFPFYEFVNKGPISNAIYNRSIEGLKLEDACELLHNCVICAQPSKVFLALGELDSSDIKSITVYENIINSLKSNLPSTEIHILSLPDDTKENQNYNNSLAEMCRKYGLKYIHIDYSKNLASIYKQLSLFFRSNKISFCDAFKTATL